MNVGGGDVPAAIARSESFLGANLRQTPNSEFLLKGQQFPLGVKGQMISAIQGSD